MSTPSIADQASKPLPTSALIFDRQLVIMIVLAAFLTTFGQPQQVGLLPIRFLILKTMHLAAPDLAKFVFLAAFAWYFKPLAGLILDSIPLFGTRRRSYMIVASGVSIFGWLIVGFASAKYSLLLYAAIGLNLFMVIASTAMGALLVEYGQNKAATGGLSSARETVQNIGGILVGFVGGMLAKLAFPITGFAGAGLMLVLFLCAVFMLKEKQSAHTDVTVWARAGEQLRTLFRSKNLGSAALMMLLIFLAPGFGSLLAQLQIKQLHFSPQQVGFLISISSVTGVIGAVVYGVICRFVNLRILLVVGIVMNVLSTLIYFFYGSYREALIIDPANQFFSELAVLPVFDLAARATPKGAEAMGFSIMMAVRNLALFGSDWAGSAYATAHNVPFDVMLVANAGFTACVLILVPFIPKSLVLHRDGAFAPPAGAVPGEAHQAATA
jgi:hypothetical protein